MASDLEELTFDIKYQKHVDRSVCSSKLLKFSLDFDYFHELIVFIIRYQIKI